MLNGTGTFAIEPPDKVEMARRMDAVQNPGLPWIVAELHGAVVGYAYASQFRPRPAYRYCLEDTVYLLPAACGQGIGRALLNEILQRCEALGARQLIAVIGDSANVRSIAVHAALGVSRTGLLQAADWKFDRWLDVVIMQRSLGAGATTAAC